jgi:hypothetical protein
MEKRLADVLTIHGGEIKPRNEAKEIFDHVFGGIYPGVSYGAYISWCMKNKRPPSNEEYKRMLSFDFPPDDGPGAA